MRILPILIGISVVSSMAVSFAKTKLSDTSKNVKYRKQCLQIKEHLVYGEYSVACNYNYHHYNSTAYKTYYNKSAAKSKGKVKIAGFNVFHPGKSNTRFKDYKYMAQIINKWDLVAAVELLAVLGDDLKHNNAVISLIARGPRLIRDLKAKIAQTTSVAAKKKLQTKLKYLKEDVEDAPLIYRAPGYLKILDELRKIDKSWALLLSPRGEAAKDSDVQELVGYYYRAKKVRPKINEYCTEIKVKYKGTPFACIPSFGTELLSRSLKKVFSRRPFMANFESGNFDFTMLASHIVFTSPQDAASKKAILYPTFRVNDFKGLGTGISSSNYARFAELKAMMMFMDKLRKTYNEKDIILTGDFNLEKKNKFMDTLFGPFPGWTMLIDKPTSVSVARYDVKGNATNGLASNYDHFVLNEDSTDECLKSNGRYDADSYVFYKHSYFNKAHLVRAKTKRGGIYPISDTKMDKVDTHLQKFADKYADRLTVKRDAMVEDFDDIKKRIKDLQDRAYLSQQYDKTFYKLYQVLLSDHIPVYMNCRNNLRDDD